MDNDLYSIAFQLQSTNIVRILDDICSGVDYSSTTDPNVIVEIYYAQQLISKNMCLGVWDDMRLSLYKANIQKLPLAVGKYMSAVTDDNWGDILQKTRRENKRRLIDIFTSYKTYENVSSEKIRSLLEDHTLPLRYVLMHRVLVNQYSNEIIQYMKSTPETAELLLSLIERDRSDRKYFFPQSLSDADKTSILEGYIGWENANPNYLKLITNSSGNSSLKISDEVKYAAKTRYDQMMNNHFAEYPGIMFGVNVGFSKEQADIVNASREGNIITVNHSTRWIDDNLDFPTLLNNFIYVFGYVDSNFRSRFPVLKSQLGIEGMFGIKGEREYITGIAHNQLSLMFSMQMKGYCKHLSKLGIDIEQIFKWFFETYLFEEFGISGFIFNASSDGTTTLEKIRNIAAEIDGVLKQFKLYCKHNHINRDLLTISSEPVLFDDVPSLISDKYAYFGSDECQNIGYLLCSDQVLLNHTTKHNGEYRNFFELVLEEDLSLDEFMSFQQNDIQKLTNYGVISIESGKIIPNLRRIYIFKELYENEVICQHHVRFEDAKDEIKTMISMGELRSESTLFSVPEAQYLNYMLNKKEFSNGHDLRNRYIHSAYPLDSRTQELDYLELLKIMALIIIKINDDICTSSDTKSAFANSAQ